jgi:hypothetical protein
MPTIKDIVSDWLVDNDHDYDGFASADNDCHCTLDCLMECDDPDDAELPTCMAGYLTSEINCPRGCDWHIIPGKRPEKEETD